MDILAPITMKNAAKCDTQCELQNSTSIRSLNANGTARNGSMSVSVCSEIHHHNREILTLGYLENCLFCTNLEVLEEGNYMERWSLSVAQNILSMSSRALVGTSIVFADARCSKLRVTSARRIFCRDYSYCSEPRSVVLCNCDHVFFCF